MALSVLLGKFRDHFDYQYPNLLHKYFHMFRFRFAVMYFIMPETEQRSLEDIERHFSDKTKRFTDIHIPKCSNRNPNKILCE